jgi:hypothetical protein
VEELDTMTIRNTRKAHAAKMAAIHADTRRIVATGCCPQCGSGFRRNLALTGWWQCEQYGTTGFRKDDGKPSCSWQGFTE